MTASLEEAAGPLLSSYPVEEFADRRCSMNVRRRWAVLVRGRNTTGDLYALRHGCGDIKGGLAGRGSGSSRSWRRSRRRKRWTGVGAAAWSPNSCFRPARPPDWSRLRAICAGLMEWFDAAMMS